MTVVSVSRTLTECINLSVSLSGVVLSLTVCAVICVSFSSFSLRISVCVRSNLCVSVYLCVFRAICDILGVESEASRRLNHSHHNRAADGRADCRLMLLILYIDGCRFYAWIL